MQFLAHEGTEPFYLRGGKFSDAGRHLAFEDIDTRRDLSERRPVCSHAFRKLRISRFEHTVFDEYEQPTDGRLKSSPLCFVVPELSSALRTPGDAEVEHALKQPFKAFGFEDVLLERAHYDLIELLATDRRTGALCT